MAEYIDRELVKEIMQKYRCSDCTNEKSLDCPLCQLHRPFAEISKIPTADVQEVRHGEWHTIRETTDSKTTECTACMKSFFFMKKGQLNIDLMPYCPNCGAKMDGKE